MKKSYAAIGMALVMLGSTLAGCSGSSSGTSAQTQATQGQETTTQAGGSESAESNISVGEKIFYWSSTAAASNISPFEGNTEIVDYFQSNLYRYIPNETKDAAMVAPDLAAKEPYTEDGYTWFIEIDPNAKWANGDLINADTFMYSWQQALDPKLMYSTPSGLAKNYIEVVNAYAYYTQESTGVPVAWEDVGFKKVDDYTVSVTTTEKYSALDVMRHFQMRYTGPVYQPLYDSCMNSDHTANSYGTEADLIMASGPFVLTSWTKGTERVFKKNENYAHADEVKLDGMTVRVVQDELTQLEMFEKGSLDYLVLGSNGETKYGDDPRTYVYESSALREIEVNFENPDKPYLGNLNFRKALYYGIDRAPIAKVTGNIAADYFIPTTYPVYADGTKYRDLPEANEFRTENYSYNPELAKEYFEKALQETGVSKVSVNLIYNEAVEDLRAASENIQSSLTALFGADKFELTVTAMNNSAAVKLMRTSQNGPTNGWDLCWGAWDLTAATYYPNRKFEPYVSTDSRRFSQYNDKVIDELYAQSVSEECRLDEKKRAEVTIAMEKEYIDQVLAIPVYQQVSKYIHSDRCILPVEERITSVGFDWVLMDIAE
ncbi:MAG: ABC transporter substrate-binding protein [bacterium]|nr:ABC transporter substrate-binding protein [bacterium]